MLFFVIKKQNKKLCRCVGFLYVFRSRLQVTNKSMSWVFPRCSQLETVIKVILFQG